MSIPSTDASFLLDGPGLDVLPPVRSDADVPESVSREDVHSIDDVTPVSGLISFRRGPISDRILLRPS